MGSFIIPKMSLYTSMVLSLSFIFVLPTNKPCVPASRNQPLSSIQSKNLQASNLLPSFKRPEMIMLHTLGLSNCSSSITLSKLHVIICNPKQFAIQRISIYSVSGPGTKLSEARSSRNNLLISFMGYSRIYSRIGFWDQDRLVSGEFSVRLDS